MANKYSDIITIREGKPAYNIANEEGESWKDFIANKQFNDILRTVIKSVRNTDVDAHRSFWISGTYGTGKSHAGAVIKHLLCDEVDEIHDYVDNEYKESQFDVLRQEIYSLRENKRLFPVMLYGQNNISHREDLSLQLQRAITEALSKAGISITVKTDFDNLVEHIESHSDIWQLLIEKSPQLASIAPTVEKLKNKLQNKDNATFGRVMEAQRKTGIDIRLASNKLADWFFEVQNELAAQKNKYGYDGLLLIWDEFTDIASSDMGPSLLVALQEIDEKVMNKENNSYFLYISHPSALNGLDNQEREKTKGRYHFMPYQMETVSAFKIMSRKFRLADGATVEEQKTIADKFFSKPLCKELLSTYAPDTTNPTETSKDLYNLFPLHPSTANLATYYAREVGSSSRSVFEFIGNNDAVKEFLDNESHFLNGDVVTADYLWDFVLDVFNQDVLKYGVVTERFNSRHLEVESKGYEYFAVFKGILLLNALNNIAANDSVTPTGGNIANLFVGTAIEPILQDILQYFDDNAIIQRLPGDDNGLYSIQFSALPTKDIEDEKNNLKASEFKHTEKLLAFNDIATRKIIDSWLPNVIRPYQYKIFSQSVNEPTLLNQIVNNYKSAKSYELFLAMLFGKNANEVNALRETASNASQDDRFKNVVFIVFEEPFTDKTYERFIEYMANSKIAGKYNQKEQSKTHLDNAFTLIKDWLNAVRRTNFSFYLRGEKDSGSTQKLTSTINDRVLAKIFSSGPETVPLLHRAPSTFWKKQSSKTIVDTFLSFSTKQEIIDRCTGPMQPMRYILQDTVDDNLEWVDGIDTNNPLFIISNFIDNKFKHTSKSEQFNMGERLKDLSLPPYGLFQSYASMGMVAFSMRKWIKQIFDLNGKPRDVQNLVEDVVELFNSWEKDKESNKLEFRFETKESRNVCDTLVKTFKLNNLKGYSEISSLTDARNAFKYGYLTEKGFPLWSLKYYDESIKEGIKTLLDNVLRIIATDNTREPKLLNDTLDGFQTYKFELGNYLNDPNAFKKGFENYLLQLPNINFRDEEFDDAFGYLEQHLENTKGLWSEEEVSKEMSNWRAYKSQEENVRITIELIGKINDIKDCKKYLAHGDLRIVGAAEERIRFLSLSQPTLTVSIPQPANPQTSQYAQKRSNAINKVKSISDVTKARKLLQRICEDENVAERIIDLINNFDA